MAAPERKDQQLSKISSIFVYTIYPLLVVIMCAFLGTTYIAQRNLREAATDEMRFTLEKRASALGYFYSERISDIAELLKDQTLANYFSNRALGMSLEYGLRASLLNMRMKFQELIDNKRIGSDSVYLRLLFFDDKGEKLVDIGQLSEQSEPWTEQTKFPLKEMKLSLLPNDKGSQMILQAPYFYKGKWAGVALAEINHAKAFQLLVYQHQGKRQASFQLEGDKESILSTAMSKMKNVPQEVILTNEAGETANESLKAVVPATPFILVATHIGLPHDDYLTSNWFFISLTALTFVVFASVAIIIRIRTNSLVLHGQFKESQRQGKVLEEIIKARTNDITIAKNEAEQAQQMLLTVLDTIPARVFWKDTNLRYLGCNKLFAKDAGRDSSEDLIGLSDYDMTWAKQASLYQEDDLKVMESQTPKLDYEEPQTTPDGKTIWLLTSKIPLCDKNGEKLGILGTYTEITERKMAQEQMEIARLAAERANRAKSEFLANMSHELRTPMHAILGFSEIGIDKVKKGKTEKLLVYLSRINESGKRLLLLLDDLLDLSKLEAGRMQFDFAMQDLQQVIDTEVSEFQELLNKKCLKVAISRPSFETFCSFDYQKILQVMRNLLSNAIKFTPEGKSISISFEKSEVIIGQRTTDTQTVAALSFSVSDEGVGLPEDELEAVFDKFVQSSKTRTGAGGTGLGLAICKEIVEGHGGRIQAANNSKGGADFTVTLPIERNSHLLRQELGSHSPDTPVV